MKRLIGLFKFDFIQKVLYSTGSQIISLLSSLVLTLIVPKFLSIESYSLWQLFIFYSSYIGLLLFGVSDGIYLRYGGKYLEKINKKRITTIVFYSIIYQLCLALGFLFILLFNDSASDKSEIIIYSILFFPLGNLITIISYYFLATNNIHTFSTSIIIDKLFIIFGVATLILLESTTYKLLIYIFFFSKILSFSYLIYQFRGSLLSTIYNFKYANKIVLFETIKGFPLMLSNIAGLLILGIGRYVIEKVWGLNNFGEISLVISSLFFFLLFISQVSLVLFPMLRRSTPDRQQLLFINGTNLISMFLMVNFLVFQLLVYLFELWLPQYTNFGAYLFLLYPICLYEGLFQIINNTFFKTLNEQKMLLKINILVIVFLILSLFLLYVQEFDINFYVAAISLAIFIRYLLSSIYLINYLKSSTSYLTLMGNVCIVAFFYFFIYNNYYFGFFTLVVLYMFGLYKSTNLRSLIYEK